MTTRALHMQPGRDRMLVLSGLVGVSALAWMYLLMGAGLAMNEMDMGGGQMMQMAPVWTLSYAALTFLMWAVMMVAMMLPTAAPTILRTATPSPEPLDATGGVATALFLTTGYLTVWIGFSVVATLLQWGLDRAGLLSDAMASRSAVVSGGTLLAAGFYQLTSTKQAFLHDCRAPIDSLSHVRKNASTTFGAGIKLGLHCLGCCSALMGLLFVVGVMNMMWIATLTLLVLFEKTLPQGRRLSHLAGAVLIAWGSWTLVTTTF